MEQWGFTELSEGSEDWDVCQTPQQQHDVEKITVIYIIIFLSISNFSVTYWTIVLFMKDYIALIIVHAVSLWKSVFH